MIVTKGGENVTHKKYCLYDFYERYGVVAECDLMILLWDENMLGFRPFYGSQSYERR